MKKLLALIIVVSIAIGLQAQETITTRFIAPAAPSISLLDHNTGYNHGSSSSVDAGPVNVPSGKTIIAACNSIFSVGTMTVTDTAMNSFVATAQGQVNDGALSFVEHFIAKNTTANASDVATCHGTGASIEFGILDAVVGGLSTSAPEDTGANGNGSTTPLTTGMFTTGTANEFIFASTVNRNSAATTWTAGTGYTLLDTEPSGDGAGASEYKIVSSIQTNQVATMAFSPSGTIGTILVTTMK